MDLYEDIQNKSEVIPIKTKEELTALKEEVEALNKKLCELTDEELSQVSGGVQLQEMEDGDPLYEQANEYFI